MTDRPPVSGEPMRTFICGCCGESHWLPSLDEWAEEDPFRGMTHIGIVQDPPDAEPMTDRPPVSGEPHTVVLDANFMQNVREALENGYDRVCARCGVGVYDDSDMHERACPEYEEPR